MTIGEKIKELRSAQNVTQERLARALRISPQAVSKWELGTGNPDVSMIAPLCHFFDVSADELCGVENGRIDVIFRENEAKSTELYAAGKITDMLALWRGAAERYPRHWPTLSRLAFAYSAAAHTYEEVPAGEDRDSLIEEGIRIGEEILEECGDADVRGFASICLIPEYIGRDGPGDARRALTIAEMAPDIHVSQQFLLRYACAADEEKRERNARDLFMICLRTAVDLMKEADAAAWPDDMRAEAADLAARIAAVGESDQKRISD
ncbi:MAG: helix-turn-helix domain-containing protein [Clostridiales bacterium]|nr:helix-turn-helix domain-containing protein [Clostridiales bacterium]